MSEDSRPPAFGSIFLTLVSIVVALGIEQLLGHVAAQIATVSGAHAFLVVMQGVTMFFVVGSIWIAYATQVMVAAWEPRFQDFFVPLFILSLLYFAISAIGSSGPAWFYLVALGTANAAIGQRFGLARRVVLRHNRGLGRNHATRGIRPGHLPVGPDHQVRLRPRQPLACRHHGNLLWMNHPAVSDHRRPG